MTLKEVKKKLEESKLPVTYRAFPVDHAPPLPFICYCEVKTEPFAADGQVYYYPRRIAVELYINQRDPKTESALEQILNTLGVWSREPIYLESQKCYEIYYEVEV